MNLSEYSRIPKNGNNEFIKWTQNGESKILRFLYTSRDGSDIQVRKKKWDNDQNRFVYDTPDGNLTCSLDCALYEVDRNGVVQNVKRVKWERSAAFTEQACNGYWAKFPRIIDGVWEVTCTNPGTKEIKFAWFPVMGADLTTHPLPEGVAIVDGRVTYGDSANSVEETSTEQADNNAAAPKTRKYWE